MANKILMKSSQDTGDGATQLFNSGGTAKLSVAELALNTVDGILFAGTDASAAAGTLIGATTDVYAQPLVVHTAAQAVGTSSDVTFADIRADAINLGHASDNTLTASSGTLSIEGVALATASSVTAAALGLQVGTNVRAKTVNRTITGVTCIDTDATVTCTAAAIQIGDEILVAGTGVPAAAYVKSINLGTEGVNVTSFEMGTGVDTLAPANASASSQTWTIAGIDSGSSAWSWNASTNGGTLTRSANLVMTAQFDGITLADDDILLVTNQTNKPEQNGIFNVSTAGAAGAAMVMARHDDYDLAAEFPNSFTFVTEGTAAADSSWVCTNDGSLTLNTTGITFAQFNAPGNVTGGTTITKVDNTLEVAAASLTEAKLNANSPTNDHVLTADSTTTGGFKWAAVGGGDVTNVIGGLGLTNDTNTGDITLDLHLTELVAETMASGDFIPFVDVGDGGTHKETIDDVATLLAGASLTATNAVLAVDDDFVKNTTDTMVDATAGLTTLTIDKNFSETGASTVKGIFVDIDKTAATTSDNTIYGVDVDVDYSTANSGTNTMIGLRATPRMIGAADAGTLTTKGAIITATGDTNGTSVATGMELTATGADTNNGLIINCADGGTDLKLVSSAAAADYATMTVGASGATAITTVDTDAAIAHLTLTIDGSLIVAADTGIDISAVGGAGVSLGLSTLDNVFVNGGSF